ncbi:MAG: helix-turn-helix domain-containing protein [Draconibacterium sp.]|nr:helix-turn-helix domain-containing protein [Draconibacterium sp.]
MKIHISFDMNTVGKIILQEQMDKLQLEYSFTNTGEFELQEPVPDDKLKELTLGLSKYGIEILENKKNILVQKIKDLIIEMVYMDDNIPTTSSISSYLTDKLNYAYGHIAHLFSSTTFTSIENFIKLQKTERAKHLIINSDLTCSEIAWKLNYSSVAHFSSQFKNVTGLTPTAFQRIINKRREFLMEEIQYEINNNIKT